jgi:cyanophycinase-like exopeptidase
MKWMIERSGKGDFYVIRSRGTKAYNPYIYNLGGVSSVTTLIIDSRKKANSPKLQKEIRKAEALFIAGGNQTDYYNYWSNTSLAETLEYLANQKKIPFGGTSAGMVAVAGMGYYPERRSITSNEALFDPYHGNNASIREGLLRIPLLEYSICDTHFSERNRLGRLVVFLARILTGGSGMQERTRAIACDEATAVCIDKNGKARIFGDYPRYQDYAYFFSCRSLPDICLEGIPLSWFRAVSVYRVAGTVEGNNTFNLINWTGTGGTNHNIGVADGRLSQDIQTPEQN